MEPRAETLDMLDEELFVGLPFAEESELVRQGADQIADWLRKHKNGEESFSIDNLSDDYFALFVGTTKVLAAPWSSVYQTKERMVFQKQTLAVRNWYKRIFIIQMMFITFSWLNHVVNAMTSI